MRIILSTAALAALCTLAWSPSAHAADWQNYRADAYGFSMLVPPGTQFAEKEHGGGWGSLVADVEGVKLYAVGRLGKPAKAKAIEAFGVKVTGIPAKAWKQIDRGENAQGWKWYRTVKAEHGGKLLFGGYGVGARGSYLLVLVTTPADFEAHRKAYERWYESVKLF